MITKRSYTSEPLFTEDYIKVREFLHELNSEKLVYPGFSWGRWEWMTTHAGLDRSSLDRIAVWEDNGKIVALATYESLLGDAYLFAAKGYDPLFTEMLAHARDSLAGENGIRINIDDNHHALQRAAQAMGFTATPEQENTAMLDITKHLRYRLPEGYRFVSMADDWDFCRYHEVMHRGFDHEGPPPRSEENIRVCREMLSSPTILPDIVLSVADPDGRYVSHCGMWYRKGDSYALVEPVATDPAYRMMGLGRAAVLEAARRCGEMGAKTALVGSTQQFYYNIGFYPVHTGSWWVCRNT